MPRAHFTTVAVVLVALLSAGVLATASIDQALVAAGAAAAAGAADAALIDDAAPSQPTKGTPQWNS